jgi:molybdopterin converting factor small subunit
MHITLGYGGDRLELALPDGAGVSVTAALHALGARRPGVFARWCDDQGRIRPSLGVFVNNEHVRYRDGLETQLRDGDEVYVIPTISGG